MKLVLLIRRPLTRRRCSSELLVRVLLVWSRSSFTSEEKNASLEILAEVSLCRSREGQARHRRKICVVMQEQTVASWHMPVKDCARSSAAFVILANIQKSITCCYMYT